MLLRSSWEASQISDPDGKYALESYEAAHGVKIPRPIPIESFVSYGRWFQSQVAPNLDRRRIDCISRNGSGFVLCLNDGEQLKAKRVIVAAGIKQFPSIPREFAEVPSSLASHAVDHRRLDCFKDREVAVIGGGQSAVESFAILRESGAAAELIMRRPAIRWLRRSGWLHTRGGVLKSALYHRTDVGPPGLSQLVARPNLFRRLPRRWQDPLAYRAIRPAAAGWLYPRVDLGHVTTGLSIATARPVADRLQLTLDDGSERMVDHALLATGYRVDVSKYGFLDHDVLRDLKLVNGYPVLASGFESSLPGLHFVGAPAAWSFGPIMRFVSGGEFAARSVARAISGAGE
jgi:cation diffusion facilitator CzcD-associated flavoprotein CzcO